MKALPLLCLCLAGCHTPARPSWSDATPQQRQAHFFTEDDAFWESPEGRKELEDMVDTAIRIRHQIGGDPL